MNCLQPKVSLDGFKYACQQDTIMKPFKLSTMNKEGLS